MISRDLITPQNFDFLVHWIYVDFAVKEMNSEFALLIYKDYLEKVYLPERNAANAITSTDTIITEFNMMIKDFRNGKYTGEQITVHIGSVGEILGDLIFCTCAVYFECDITTEYIDGATGGGCTYRKMKDCGINDIYLDFLIFTYSRLCNDLNAMLVQKTTDIDSLLCSSNGIICDKLVKFNARGIKNFSHCLNFLFNGYEDGISWNHLFETDNIRKDTVSIRLIVFCDQTRCIRDFDAWKQLSGNDAATIIGLICNENSTKFLNTGNPLKYHKIEKFLKLFIDAIEARKLNFDDFIIESSSVMAVYGIRDAADLDYLTKFEDFSFYDLPDLENRNKYLEKYGVKINDLLYNPQNYFYFGKVKFATLDLLKQFKFALKRGKDYRDIALIDRLLLSDVRFKIKCNIYYRLFAGQIAYISEEIEPALKKVVLPILHYLKIYKYIRKLKLKRKQGA